MENESRNPHSATPESGFDRAAWLATILSGSVLIQGIAGGPFWKDAGELSVSVLDMGVAHPTGFPSWAALGRVFSLLPLGTNHLRLGLASALPMAICVGLIAHFLRPTNQETPARALDIAIRGIALPALVLSSPTIWYLGTTPEVYALAALLALLLVHTFTTETIGKPHIARGSVLLGLVPGVHITAIFGAVALFSRASLKQCVNAFRDTRLAVAAGSLFFLSISSVAALSLAAARNAEINFDNPQSPGALWSHLTAQGIQERFAGAGARPGLSESLDLHGVFMNQEFGILALVLALVGAAAWRAHPLARTLTLMVMADMAYNIWINPMGRRDAQTGVLTILCVWALAFLGTRALVNLRPRFTTGLWAVATLLLIFSRGDSLQSDINNRSAIRSSAVPVKLMRASLSPLAPGSLVFTTSDDVIGLMLAARRVEGRRPDVRQILTSFAWWPWHLEKQGLSAPSQEKQGMDFSTDEAQLSNLKQILRNEAPGRMILWEPGAGALDAVVGSWLQPGLLFGVVQEAQLLPVRWPDPQAAALTLSSMQPAMHSWSRRVLSETLRLNAVNATRKQQQDRAMNWSKAAVDIDQGNGRAWNNLGVGLLKGAQNRDALEAMTRAADLRPYDSRIWRNLGLAFLQNQHPDRAQAAFQRSAEIAQTSGDRQRAEELLKEPPAP